MARTIQITFDASSPRLLGEFWRQVLDYAVDPPPGWSLQDFDSPEATLAAWHELLREQGVPESAWDSAYAVVDPAGAGPRLWFQQVPEPKTAKNRVHVDVRAAEGLQGEERMATLEDEAARLVGLGATRLRRFEPGEGMGAGFVVMADPEGNEFCLD